LGHFIVLWSFHHDRETKLNYIKTPEHSSYFGVVFGILTPPQSYSVVLNGLLLFLFHTFQVPQTNIQDKHSFIASCTKSLFSFAVHSIPETRLVSRFYFWHTGPFIHSSTKWIRAWRIEQKGVHTRSFSHGADWERAKY